MNRNEELDYLERIEDLNKAVQRLLSEISMSTDKEFYQHCLVKVRQILGEDYGKKETNS